MESVVGHQWMFSLCSEVSEETATKSESSVFDPESALKLKDYSSSEIEEVEEDSEWPNSLNSNDDLNGTIEVNYDSEESCISYITARDEMEEEDDDDDFYGRRNNRFHMGLPRVALESVFIAVGKGRSSLGALSWALNNFIKPSTNIYLIHVLPEIRYIPSPMGRLPKQNVSAKIVVKYRNQEREKAKEFLQKILDGCASPFDIQNKVDVVLVESNDVGKTLINLITFLNINKLVIGTRASRTRSRLAKFRKNGIAHQVVLKAPKTCEVKLVCGGKEVIDPLFATPLLTPASSRRVDDSGTPSSSPPSSRRSSVSSNFSWFKRPKSCADFQVSEDKKQGVCFYPGDVFARSRYA